MKNYQKRLTIAVYLIKDDQILFLVRDKKNDQFHKKGMYLGLGGHVELQESIESAAIREVQEESSITLHSLKLVGICHFRAQENTYDNTMFVFTSKDFSGEPVKGREGDFQWVDKKDIFSLNTYESDAIFFRHMLNRKFFVIDFYYKEDKMVDYNILTLLENH